MKKEKAKKLSLTEWLFEIKHNYSLMHSAGVLGGALIAFDHEDCEYYIAPGVKLQGEQLNELLNYLRWDFDNFQPVTKEIEKEVEEKTKSGNITLKKIKEEVVIGIENKFPATPENIKKMKSKVMAEALESSESGIVDRSKIVLKVVPRLSDHEKILQATAHKRSSDVDQLAARLKNSL